MVEGDFFKKREYTQEKKEEKLIDNERELRSTYDLVITNIDETSTDAYNSIIYLRDELEGDPNSTTNVGLINMLRREFRDRAYKIARLEIGRMMLSILDKIEDLDRTSDNYAQNLEKHMRALVFLCKSGFAIIESKNAEINELAVQIRRMEEHLKLPSEGEIRKEESPSLTEKRKGELRKIYENCRTLIEFIEIVNPRKKGREFTPNERKFLTDINLEIQKFRKHKTEEPKDKKSEEQESEENLEVFSPVTENPENQEVLYKEKPPKDSDN